MALGDGGNNNYNNQNKEQKRPTVYSPISFKNPDAKVDPSEISFQFWKNLLGITISPKLERKPGDAYDTYDRKNNITIHLTHQKARMFRNLMVKMLKDPTMPDVSVASGQSGLITLSNGKEYGVDGFMIIIRNLDEAGQVTSSYSYEINGKGYYGILNFNEKDSTFDRELFESLELDAILDLLEDFYRSTNYALAYTVVDANRFDNSRTQTKLDLVMEKLGIEKRTGGNSGTGRSFFDNVRNGQQSENSTSSAASTKGTSLDKMAQEMEEDDDLPF